MDKSFEWPEWALALKYSYEENPTKWLWGGGAAIVILIILALVVPRYFAQKAEAAELFTEGMQALSSERYPEAIRIFEKILSSYPLSGLASEVSLYRAAGLYGMERYPDAEAEFRSYLEKNSGNVLAIQARMGIAACREALGDTSAALAELKAARAAQPNSFAVKAMDFQIARLSEASGDAATSSKILDELAADSEGVWRELVRGRRKILEAEAGLSSAAGASESAPPASGR